jgi:putative hydrolase of the HAD superfamily
VPHPELRFVYFDAGGTLIAPVPSVGAVYARAGAPFGLRASAVELERAFRELFSSASRSAPPRVDEASTRAFWQKLVLAVLDQVGFTKDARSRREVFEACYTAFAEPAAWRIFDDVRPTLEGLAARGIGLGVLSNWDHRLGPLLGALGLAQYFGPVLISAEQGFEKPDPRLFLRAVERAGVPAASMAHVGDNPALDVVPALDAGWRAALIDRDGKRSVEPPALSLSSLTELLHWT